MEHNEINCIQKDAIAEIKSMVREMHSTLCVSNGRQSVVDKVNEIKKDVDEIKGQFHGMPERMNNVERNIAAHFRRHDARERVIAWTVATVVAPLLAGLGYWLATGGLAFLVNK